MHLNDPEGVARRALELAVNDRSELRYDTRAGFGNSERALVAGITSAVCEMLRDMFQEGVEIDQAAKEAADETYASDLARREADLEERENSIAAREKLLAQSITPPNDSIEAVADATPDPTGNDGVAERAAAEEQLRAESIASAEAKAQAEQDAELSDPHPSDTDAEPGDEVETGPGPHGEAAGETVDEHDTIVDNADTVDPASMSYADLQAYAETHGVSKTNDDGKMRSKATLLEELAKH